MNDTIYSASHVEEELHLPAGCAAAMVESGRWPAIRAQSGELFFREEFVKDLIEKMPQAESPKATFPVVYIQADGNIRGGIGVAIEGQPNFADIIVGRPGGGDVAKICGVPHDENRALGTWHHRTGFDTKVA